MVYGSRLIGLCALAAGISITPRLAERTNGDKLAEHLALVEQETITASRFLLICSPTERKITWTQILDINKALDDRVYPLVDGGLLTPKGNM